MAMSQVSSASSRSLAPMVIMRGRHKIYVNSIEAIPVVLASLGLGGDGGGDDDVASSCCSGVCAGSRPAPSENPVLFDIFTDGDSQASTASSRRACGVSIGIDASVPCPTLVDIGVGCDLMDSRSHGGDLVHYSVGCSQTDFIAQTEMVDSCVGSDCAPLCEVVCPTEDRGSHGSAVVDSGVQVSCDVNVNVADSQSQTDLSDTAIDKLLRDQVDLQILMSKTAGLLAQHEEVIVKYERAFTELKQLKEYHSTPNRVDWSDDIPADIPNSCSEIDVDSPAPAHEAELITPAACVAADCEANLIKYKKDKNKKKNR
eukprot:TRINITY_DN17178_c0_g1_i4.p1 TRINITY_DN17178_c0_g1~~TRINITY_DN17178_c0_g1_i4.p1  ORF type:complete len:315 (-),score=58.08 TRINITY_DN17178_c0_g1_i4:232-1176(-)